ncbi:MAG TPA: adenylate/guanylate cyclase domain-containing protein, partial [Chthoniobacterales bacterium]|nr:adenylate/guanylate cyclase domain-containing protein [Chthoniobacterales bacterium]
MQWLARHRLIALGAICIFWTGLILLGQRFSKVPFLNSPWVGEQNFEDKLRRDGRTTPERTDFVFVGIDEASKQMHQPNSGVVGAEEVVGNRGLELMAQRPFPWSREVWAVLLDRLFEAGARLVMFDMIFDRPNDGDPAFAAALEKYKDRVVLGLNLDIGMATPIIMPNTQLIPPPQQADDRVGFINFWPEPIDGKVRGAFFHRSEREIAGYDAFQGDEIFTSFVARAMSKMGHAKDVPDDLNYRLIRFGPVTAYPPVELWKIFFPPTWNSPQFRGGEFFKGKVVIVGDSSQIGHDVVATPLGPSTPGPALHLHAMAAAIGHEYLAMTPTKVAFLLVCLGGLAACGFITFVRRPLVGFLGLVGGAILYLVVARVLYDSRGFFLIAVPVLSAFTLSGITALGFDYALERLEKLRTRRTLERYVSKNLVKEILDNPDSYYHSLLGVRVPATMLFSDIIGFTTLSEKADPEELVKHLNEYLTKMTAVIFEHGGTLDKFIGDAVMAVWGNVHSYGVTEDAKRAVRAAYGMRLALKTLNDSWREQGRMGLGMGVGINQGEVIVG